MHQSKFSLTSSYILIKRFEMIKPTQSLKFQGSLSILISASIWGLFWIPLRYFDEAGVHSLWAVAYINLTASLVALPVAFLFGKFERNQVKWLLIMGLGMGAANVFYFAGIILSDVIRVIFLFYLLPIWATLFSKLLYNVPMGKKRMFALLFTLAGIWLLLGAGGWPKPQNIGDVFGILAGMFWALGLAMMRGIAELDALFVSASALFFAFIMAIVLGLVMHALVPNLQPAMPSFQTAVSIALPVMAFGILILWTTMFGQLWGAKYVAATTAALLTMSEILAATLSTALLDASSLSWVSWAGAGLIMVAILIDLFAGNSQKIATA